MNNRPTNNFQILLKGSLEEIDYLSTEIERFCEEVGLEDLVKNQVNLILEELYTNTANYGFKDIPEGRVSITLSVLGDQLEITYQDNGIAFNPLEIDDPDLLLSLEDRAIGGLGVFFVKAMTDKVTYARVGEFNYLTMQKSLLNKSD